ncbi:hypothetical protein Tco_0860905 [Tanacetum coccineum]|uniref:Uncharacterized protein n=1 Tax=Tanacetum coccineum TaxID=301880 RepID=A0ABQ5BJZ4_9ASTR
MYYLRFTKVIIHYFLTQDKTLSWRNKIGMHTSKDDYLINTLRFVSTREETQIYGVVLSKSLASLEMKETEAYKTYLGFATGATPPKKARKFKKPASPKLTTVPALTEEPTGNQREETPEIPVSKKKEKVDVARGKGIELLSDVALTEEGQYEEVRKKILRDFHKTHPSGSGTATKPTPSAAIIKPSVTNKGTGGNDDDDSNNDQDSRSEESDQDRDSDDDKSQSDNEDELDSEHETDDNKSGSESDQEEDDEKIEDDETKIDDKAKGDEDEEMDYTTSLLYVDVDIRLNEPVDTDKGFVQEKGTDAAMTNKTEVPVSSSSRSSDLAAKFLNFSDIPTTEAKIVSPLDVLVHHEVPSQQTPTFLTVPILVIFESSPVFSIVIPQSLQSFAPPPLLSTPTPPPTTKATNPPLILPDFASVFEFNNRATALEQEVAVA